MNKIIDKDHFVVIDTLRGVAALLVVIVHVSINLEQSWITKIASYGQYGVIIFCQLFEKFGWPFFSIWFLHITV